MIDQVVGRASVVLISVLLTSSGLSARDLTGEPHYPTSYAAGTTSAGIALVDRTVWQPTPADERHAQAISSAQQLAFEHPDDFGYPWLAPSGAVELRPVTEVGHALALATDLGDTDIATSVGGSLTALSDLESIRDALIQMRQEGLEGSTSIYRLEPDHYRNRIVIGVTDLSGALDSMLATRFGTSRIAIRIDRNGGGAQGATRLSDTSPFWGGARINTPTALCSDGIPWKVSSTVFGMLTAAHCVPAGGSISTPAQAMGTVAQSSEENWNPGNGTVPYAGQSTNRGDVALIRISSGKSASALIYRGDAQTGYGATVRYWTQRYAQLNDRYCTSGQNSGEICGYSVFVTGVDEYYLNLGGWARNIVEGTKAIVQGSGCIGLGDSGGAIYSVNGDGTLTARGVISGYVNWLGESCDSYFTDIYVSYAGLPGAPLVTG